MKSVRIRNFKSETRVDGRLMLIHGIFGICLNQRRVILCRAFLQESRISSSLSVRFKDLVDDPEMIARRIKDSISAHAKGKVGLIKWSPL